MRKQKSMMGLGALTALASSLCCITPLVAVIAGSSSFASSFQWIEPLRPWLIGTTLLTLGLAWYLQFRPRVSNDCECDVVKTSFWRGRTFLTAITLFSVIMLFFPMYANALYPQNEAQTNISPGKVEHVKFVIDGMTCSGCEGHVEHAVSELPGIIEVVASFENANASITYDPAQTSLDSIRKAIISTSYKVGDYQFFQSSNSAQ